jgi:MHS family alpha-ketoglutarate permease-like MFS transporter
MCVKPLLMLCGLLIVSSYSATNAVAQAELFPTEIRALGVGFPSAMIVAFFGGTVEYIALYFKNSGYESGFFWYITLCVFISLIGCFLMHDPQKISLIEDFSKNGDRSN